MEQVIELLQDIKKELQEINNSLKPKTRHFKIDEPQIPLSQLSDFLSD